MCNWKGKDNKMDASPANLHTAESKHIKSETYQNNQTVTNRTRTQ